MSVIRNPIRSAVFQTSTGINKAILSRYGSVVIPGDTDFIVEIGQSNLLSVHGTPASAPVPNSGVTFTATASSVSAMTQTGNLEPAFANAMNDATGRKVIMMNRAVDGSALLPATKTSNWNKATGPLYANAVTAINDALTWIAANTAHDIGRVFVLYAQGESDAQAINGSTITGPLYEADLELLASNLNADITGGINDFLLVRLGAHNLGTDEADWAEIRLAQDEAARDSSLIRMVHNTANTFPANSKMADNLHWNQAGLNDVGATAGANAANGVHVNSFFAPVNTTLPGFTGTQQVNRTLTKVAGVWDGYPAPVISAQRWRNSGVAISGATGLTYLIDTTDEGDTLNVAEDATNSEGTTTAQSASTGPIAPASGGHVPTDTATLEGWYDADDSSTLWADAARSVTATAEVYTWDDKSGNGRHLIQPTLAQRFETGTRTENSKNALELTGSEAMYIDNSMGDLGNGNNTVFIVYRKDSPGSAFSIFYHTTNISTNAFGAPHLDYFSGNLRAGHDQNPYSSPNLLALAANADLHVAGTIRDGTGVAAFYDGTVDALDSNAIDRTVDRFILGASNITGGTGIDGLICEVLVFSSALSDADMNLNGNYLADKWGGTWVDI